jgi:outer membrane protein
MDHLPLYSHLRKSFATFLFVLSCAFSIAQEGSWDLKRSVEYALANNISVKRADIDARVAALTLKQSRLTQIPSASITADAGITSGRSINPVSNLFVTDQLFTTSFGFSSGVNVFNFFSTRNTIKGNQYEAEASRLNVDRVRNDIALNVATSYLQILLAVEQANIADVAVQQSLQNFDNTRRRVEAGALPELNLAEIEAQLVRDSANLIVARNTVEQNKLLLKAILNLEAAAPFDVAIPPLEKIPVQPIAELQPAEVFRLAQQNLPQFRVNDLRIKAAHKFAQAARGQMFPSIGAFGGLGSSAANNKIPNENFVPNGTYTNTPSKVTINGSDYFVQTPNFDIARGFYRVPFGTQYSDNFRQNIGLSLNVPLFNYGNARTAWERSKLNIASFELQKTQDLLDLKQDIYQAYNDASTAIQQYSARQKSAATAEKAYNFAQRRYELGLLSTIDLLTNQNNLTRARVELAQARLEYVFRLKLLEFYKGEGLRLE